MIGTLVQLVFPFNDSAADQSLAANTGKQLCAVELTERDVSARHRCCRQMVASHLSSRRID